MAPAPWQTRAPQALAKRRRWPRLQLAWAQRPCSQPAVKASPAPVLSTTDTGKLSNPPLWPATHQRSGLAPSVISTSGRPGRLARMGVGSSPPNSHWASSALHFTRAARSSSQPMAASAAGLGGAWGAGGAVGASARSQKQARQFTSTARGIRSSWARCTAHCSASAAAGLARGIVPLTSQRAGGNSASRGPASSAIEMAWSAKSPPPSAPKPVKLRSPPASRCTNTRRLARAGSHCRALVPTPRACNSRAMASPPASRPSRPMRALGVPRRARAQATLAGAPPT